MHFYFVFIIQQSKTSFFSGVFKLDIFNRKKIAQLENRVEDLLYKVGDTQMMGDILTNKLRETSTSTYVGNEYTNYNAAITEINDKYVGTADWGCWSGNIIDVRSAFIIGKGLKIVKVEDNAEREMEWAKEFFRINDLYLYLPITFTTEAEIEGKFLAKLFYDENAGANFKPSLDGGNNLSGMIKVRFISWQTYQYIIATNPNDYLNYISAKSNPEGEKLSLSEDEFVYRKFGGRASDPNQATPKLWRSLTQIDEISQAYRDWREINRIFAAPFLYLKCSTEKEVKKLGDLITRMNFRIKKLLWGTADPIYLTPDARAFEMLEKEIVTKLKSVSGNTGVPVHFMGLPDLMSNRSTAENLMELIWASTKKEREIWESAYTEVLRKSMIMYNDISKKTPLDPMKLEIQIPEVDESEWLHLEKVWLPLYVQDAITLETLLSKIPTLDMGIEEKRRKKQDKEELVRLKENNALMKQQKKENGQNDDDEEEEE
jgi:hypothetical protein